MINYRWCVSGTLDEICQDLHNHRFPAKVFLTVSKGPGWYRIDNDTWLIIREGEHRVYRPGTDLNRYRLFYWPSCDPRPFLRSITILKGFK